MASWVYLTLALFAGFFSVLQSGVNSSLGRLLSSPWAAATISFGGGALSMVVLTSVTGSWSSLAGAARLPWWLWTGGLAGAMIVCTAIVTVPHIGAASLVTAMVAGQLLTAVVCDHYGWLGFPHHPATLPRLLGVGLVFAGMLVVRRF